MSLGPPLGFGNFGSGTLTNFGLYEFGGAVPAGGLLKLEMEYMEIRLPSAVPEPSTLLLAAMALACVVGLKRHRLLPRDGFIFSGATHLYLDKVGWKSDGAGAK